MTAQDYRGAAECVLRPADTDRWRPREACAREGVAIVPQGGHRTFRGSGRSEDGADRASLARMNRIAKSIRWTTARLEAGCILHVQQAAERACAISPALAAGAVPDRRPSFDERRGVNVLATAILANRSSARIRACRRSVGTSCAAFDRHTGYDLRIFSSAPRHARRHTAAYEAAEHRPPARRQDRLETHGSAVELLRDCASGWVSA